MKAAKILGGFVVIASAVLIALLAYAAPGDVAVILKAPQQILTSPQKSLLADAVTASYPSANVATVQRYYCRRSYDDLENPNDIFCGGHCTKEMSLSDYIDQDIEGKAGKYISDDGSSVTYERRYPPAIIDATAKAATKTFVEDVFASIQIGATIDFECKRAKVNGQNEIVCAVAYLDVVSPENYLILKKQGSVIRPIERM